GAGFAAGVGSRGGDAAGEGSGGGGGYFGGGASQGDSAAGGGSSWPTTATLEAGVQVGHGEATITYDQPNAVVVKTAGTGSGRVTAQPPVIDCGLNRPASTDCSQTVGDGAQLMLTAAPAANTNFVGWSGGGCSGDALTCSIAPENDATITATFAAKPRTLAVTTAGPGAGYVTSQPAGIDCGRNIAGHADCAETVTDGTVVTLIANPDESSDFSGFTGAGCSAGAFVCEVSMTEARAVTGTFTKAVRTVYLDLSGSGGGFVTSSPGGIDCGRDAPGHGVCAATFDHGTEITFTVNPNANSRFSGWTAGTNCGNNPTCTITVGALNQIGATFTRIPRTLSLSSAGTGGGYVTSSPGAINCGHNPAGGRTSCATSSGEGLAVTLTANPSANSDFAGFTGGGCSGEAPTCIVTMNGDQTVTANYTLKQRLITVNLTGNGAGSVSSAPAGISCSVEGAPRDCSTSVPDGTVVVLTASPRANSGFSGFTGAGCSGDAITCSFTAGSDLTVAAAFQLDRHALTVSATGNGSGVITSDPVGIDCSARAADHADCADSYDHGTSVVLTATPASNTDFGGFSGAGCTGPSLTCTVSIDRAQAVSGAFTIKKRNVSVASTGKGTVTSDLGGIACPAACTTQVDQGTTITLSAKADPGARFADFATDECPAAGDRCTLTVGARDVTVRATFETPTLTIDEATDVTPSTATVQGSIDPKGAEVRWAVRYFTDPAVVTTLPLATIAASAGRTPVRAALTDLQPDTTYTYLLVAQASGAELVSERRTLRTGRAPVVPEQPLPTATPAPPVAAPTAAPTSAPTAAPTPVPLAEPVATSLSLTLAKQALVIGRVVVIGCRVGGSAAKTCKVTLKTAAGVVLGSATGAATVRIRLSAAAVARIARNAGGLSSVATGTATTTSGQSVSGKAQTKLVIQNRRITSVRNTFGGFGSTPTAAGTRYLKALAAQLRSAGVSTITCTGYAASVVGPRETRASRVLSARRAAAACKVLRDAGLNVRYVIVGAGKARPVASNRTNAGRALNRRVEIKVTYAG
ncbi:MAG: OmpA family protein, partial [Solirubrobacteraceae bacterium]|nr:OmpA family protein [Solirubrobacteraceae bacterium]